jgi:hypothetical protein
MTNAKPDETKAQPLTIASAVDANGQVTVWDHGPQPPDAEKDSDEMKRHEAEVEAWEAASAGMPQPILMDATTASAAIAGDPVRYTLEPVGLDEGAVAERVKKIQDERAARVKAAEERIKAIVDEVRGTTDVILFLDELHTLVGAGGSAGGMDAANILKPKAPVTKHAEPKHAPVESHR